MQSLLAIILHRKLTAQSKCIAYNKNPLSVCSTRGIGNRVGGYRLSIAHTVTRTKFAIRGGMEVNWKIPTTVKRFVTWFEEYHKPYERKHYQAILEDSSQILFALKPSRVSQVQPDKAYISIDADIEMVSPEGTVKKLESMWHAVDIQLIQIETDQLELKGKFHHPGLNEYYQVVLSSMKKRWNITDLSKHLPEQEEENIGATINSRGPGRPSLTDDTWAINELRAGRLSDEVKKDWLQRPGVIERNLQDPDRQFKRLINYASKPLRTKPDKTGQ